MSAVGTASLCRLIQSERWLDAELRASFDSLAADRYLRSDPCFRYRAYGDATLNDGRLSWRPHGPFFQSASVNEYAGGIVREFAPLGQQCRRFAERLVADLALGGYLDARRGAIGCHQIRVVAEDSFEGHPTPEGFHRDGFDLVAMTCVAQANVQGGVTRVVTVAGREPLLDRALRPGETIVLDDRVVEHYVTPIRPERAGHAHRDVVVITFSNADFVEGGT
jgi:hypothetical protein